MSINKKDLVKIEGNICEYPFFNLSKSGNKIEKKEYFFNPILEDGKVEERKLILETSKVNFGLPSSFDMDVLIAISQIGTEKKSLTGRIYFTLYDIAKRLCILNKEVRIRESILKMYHVNCCSENSILVKDQVSKKKKYLTSTEYFHIFDNIGFLDTKREKNKRKAKEETYVRFNEYFVQNFFSGYFQYIDFRKYISLKMPIAKRLYIFLSKKRSAKHSFKISITKLSAILPIESKKLFHVRQILKRACERLKSNKIISDYKLEKGAMDITFYFPVKGIAADTDKEEDSLKLSDGTHDIYKALIEIGITEGVVKQLIKAYPTERIERQLQWLKLRKSITDPPAVLVSSIRDDWAPPKEVVKKDKDKETHKKIENLLKKAYSATFIVLSSGKQCEILKVSDEAIEFIEDNERRVMPINQALKCKFKD